MVSAATALQFDSPALPADSVVVVSGANGFIASHITDQLLAAGYRVRGTVRDPERSHWLSHYFNKYDSGRFELLKVSDVTRDGAFDEALNGAHGVIHTVAITNLDPNPGNVVPVNVAATLGIARSAARSPSITRFVYTSSSGAAAIPKPGVSYEVKEDTYNEEAVAIAYSGKGPAGPAGGYLAYSAAKTKAEQALWKWYREEKPGFVLNSIVPNAALGHVLIPEHQGFPTAVGLLKSLWDGQLTPGFVSMFPSQWYCDVVDIARVHIAALLLSDVNSERLLAYAYRFTINDLLQTFRETHPDRKFPEDIPDLKPDMGKVDNQRATDIIKKLGLPGWTDLHDCLKPLADQYAAASKY